MKINNNSPESSTCVKLGVGSACGFSIVLISCGSGRVRGIRCLFDPGSGIRNRFFPDPGSRIPNLYFWELIDDSFYHSLQIGPTFSSLVQKKIIYNFVIFVATKKGRATIFPPFSIFYCFWIRDKHTGSAKLVLMHQKWKFKSGSVDPQHCLLARGITWAHSWMSSLCPLVGDQAGAVPSPPLSSYPGSSCSSP